MSRALLNASLVSRISRSPERNTRTSPGGSFSSSTMASTMASVWSRGAVRTSVRIKSWSGSSGSSSSPSAATTTSRAGCEPARLGVPDGAADAAAQFQADLRQLGGLARPGLAGDDDDLVLGHGLRDLAAPVADWKVRVGDRGEGRFAGGDERLGGGE